MDPQVYPSEELYILIGFKDKKLFLHITIRITYTGLGSEVNDICGRDWTFEGGDHGDPGNNFVTILLLLMWR